MTDQVTVLSPVPLHGALSAMPSKSAAHRLLLASGLSALPSLLHFRGSLSEDILATMRCLSALGTSVKHISGDSLLVEPKVTKPTGEFDCGESGSTLRFMLPVAAALGQGKARFTGKGRLPQRPLGDLCAVLAEHGCTLSGSAVPLTLSGRLTGGEFVLPGNVSSQYITGLLFALPLTEQGGRIILSTELQSAAYVEMTLRTLRAFGIQVETLADGWRLAGRQSYVSPVEVPVEGDWSNAAAFLCAGALQGPVAVLGLDNQSAQGDRRIVDILRGFGAEVSVHPGKVEVRRGQLRGQIIDMAEIPDLLPVLAAFAAAVPGRTVLCHAERVRLKECDRVSAMATMLRATGCVVEERPDGLVIDGGGSLHGAAVDVCNDHRLVMAASLLTTIVGEPLTITEAGAVAKSYPEFLEDWRHCQQRPTVKGDEAR